jgi:hypothetical protein
MEASLPPLAINVQCGRSSPELFPRHCGHSPGQMLTFKTRLQTLTIEPNNSPFDPIVDSRFTLPKAHSSYVWLKSKQHDSFSSITEYQKLSLRGKSIVVATGGPLPPRGRGIISHVDLRWGGSSPQGVGVTPPMGSPPPLVPRTLCVINENILPCKMEIFTDLSVSNYKSRQYQSIEIFLNTSRIIKLNCEIYNY